MAQVKDPVQAVLEDLGRLRARLHTEMVRFPVPDPFRQVLSEVDQIFSQTEDSIRSVIGKTLAQFSPGEVASMVKTLRRGR